MCLELHSPFIDWLLESPDQFLFVSLTVLCKWQVFSKCLLFDYSCSRKPPVLILSPMSSWMGVWFVSGGWILWRVFLKAAVEPYEPSPSTPPCTVQFAGNRFLVHQSNLLFTYIAPQVLFCSCRFYSLLFQCCFHWLYFKFALS